jgi:hypothetical protein
MSKKIKMDKSVRQLLEANGDMVKKKNGVYRFKSKNKKTLKKIKKNCTHWIIKSSKRGPESTIQRDPSNQYWICTLCGQRFPIKPKEVERDASGQVVFDPYEATINEALEIVNHAMFLSVRAGGDADDMKIMLQMKENLPKLRKIVKRIFKLLRKRNEFENRMKANPMDQFSAYGGINYR